MPKIIFQWLQFLVEVVEGRRARGGEINLNLLPLYSWNTEFPEKIFILWLGIQDLYASNLLNKNWKRSCVTVETSALSG